ncbi:MAG: 1-acyl-sn-glycerol-3-phosphate acyltransferase [Sandaracinaceae bacterium]|nr:1-acyl-sn-glycerol-3-phosphate acyltransferase [Sandaracinaceae bacterium]
MSPLERVRTLGRAVSFAAWTSGVVYSHKVFARFDEELETPRGKRQFIYTWSRGAFPLLGVDLTLVDGDVPSAIGRSYLVVSNHRSPLDILVCVHLVGGVVLSHHGVADIPVIGTAARATDTIFVDRDDSRSGAQAIRQMRRCLKAGQNVIVFPEGTTFAGDEVRPFKPGAFTAAKGLDHVRVLPVGVAYEPGSEFVEESFGNHARRMAARPRTPVWATIGEPVDVPRKADQQEALRSVVQSLADRSAAARDRGAR